MEAYPIKYLLHCSQFLLKSTELVWLSISHQPLRYPSLQSLTEALLQWYPKGKFKKRGVGGFCIQLSRVLFPNHFSKAIIKLSTHMHVKIQLSCHVLVLFFSFLMLVLKYVEERVENNLTWESVVNCNYKF